MEVQCEQLSRELARQREYLEREAQALQDRLTEAREEGRAETCKQKEELAHTVNFTYKFFLGVENSGLEVLWCICLYCSSNPDDCT